MLVLLPLCICFSSTGLQSLCLLNHGSRASSFSLVALPPVLETCFGGPLEIFQKRFCTQSNSQKLHYYQMLHNIFKAVHCIFCNNPKHIDLIDIFSRYSYNCQFKSGFLKMLKLLISTIFKQYIMPLTPAHFIFQRNLQFQVSYLHQSGPSGENKQSVQALQPIGQQKITHNTVEQYLFLLSLLQRCGLIHIHCSFRLYIVSTQILCPTKDM